ncbi:uncharacterized protein BT62DRAFT_451986 [Guyanagaster necrorhizus]|uniref:Uncharacterized protein n=1 Tax=Guyanagaster necrorhizus TaxID=856835 RepID=A0A9P7VK82_9AGAR|nr:uncharacterized protein BT62DRAFT_451986 [Guyanagaster necrorhizus MCA 3950]KAG7442239.1 hypothetical protein BT62DRAFT_451986 [Guyanagaster necrorhizus MCA 3950]
MLRLRQQNLLERAPVPLKTKTRVPVPSRSKPVSKKEVVQKHKSSLPAPPHCKDRTVPESEKTLDDIHKY